jgi:hypothetical protein
LGQDRPVKNKLAPVVTLLLLAATARAAEDRGTASAETRAGEATVAAPSTRPEANVEQPFLYLVDPHGPAARQLLAGYALAFSSSGGAIRPIPGHFDAEGVVHALSLTVGVVDRVQLFGATMIAQSIGQSEVGSVAVQAGARAILTPARWTRLKLMVQAAFLREFSADLGVTGEITGTYDIGRVRLAAAAHVEHVFAAGRDPVDLYAVAGVSVRVVPILRLGAEYVAQDLEAAFEPEEAEHGARHYPGPNAALALYRRHILVTGGAAVEAARTPGVLARAALTYVY